MFHVPERFRLASGLYGSDATYGNNGAFLIKSLKVKHNLYVIASDQAAPGDTQRWEHVSVSIPGQNICPTWADMCFVKDLFWDAEDCVVQFHPPESEYVNRHPYTLHLWRPVGLEWTLPPKEMVG